MNSFIHVDKRLLKLCIVFGMIHSVVYEYGQGLLNGRSMYEYFDSVRAIIKYILIIGIKGVAIAGILYICLWAIGKMLHKHQKYDVSINIWVIWGIVVIPFFIAYLAFFPGVTSYDAYDVILQAKGTEKSDFQPYLYTFLFTVLYKIETVTGVYALAVVAMTLIQIGVVTYSVATLICHSQKIFFGGVV